MTSIPAALPHRPSLLGKLNERHVVQMLQSHGPLSRAQVTRRSGLSAPTVSKAVASLLRAGLLEEQKPDRARGRPAKKLHLASQCAQVIGVVIDARHCQIVAAGLDGRLDPQYQRSIATPGSFRKLIDALADSARQLMDRPGMTTLGIGLSMPGLIDYRRQQGILSPNVPQTDSRTPGIDLGQRLGIECAMFQESHALCLAERHHGQAQGLDDFAMLDVSTGVGLGVMSGGRLLTGHSGLAGEIGHICVLDNGRRCGCGNRGCLETVAGDSPLAWHVSRRLGRKVSITQLVDLVRSGKLSIGDELEQTCRYLAIAVAAVINLFNPATLFVHGHLFETDRRLFGQMVKLAQQRSLPPSFADCRIIQAQGSKPQGAVAGIIRHLANSIAPQVQQDAMFSVRPEW
jgi:predicted NBD/HSP70 family sugar kinase